MYTTAPAAAATAPADPNVDCTLEEPDPQGGIEEPYCLCTSGSSTETAPLITIASPTIYSQSCEYSTWPGTTTSISTDLPPPTTNTKACMVCTAYAMNEDNCNTIPNCTPQIAVATLTVGSAPVHVGTLTGAPLFTSTTTSTQCSETGEVDIGGIQYVDSDESLNTGSLVVKVPTSGYNATSLRDAMIGTIALSVQTSATGSNCFNVSYEAEQLKRQHMTMCNGAYFHTANYYDPDWRTAPQPGPSDFINALLSFEVSNSDQFLCEFLDMLVDGLTLFAPEFAVEDVELEEGIDTLCCLADGGCQLENPSISS
ncbi:hypothetical protein N431DRAFT_411379 [Stipitochalara longipes BDJ]|nr:hypothetical protein N431DRAFT_411379 [Stipitochalara longipes BDJ]